MPMKPPLHHSKRQHQQGIALVVIAALFIAFSVVAAVAVERNTTTQLITRRDSTAEQLQRISNAIIEYSVFNQVGGKLVYPCPARPDLAGTDANFGVSVNTAGTQDCNVTNHTGIAVLGTDVIRGMVPIQSLSQYGLGVNDAFDPWNNRIMYVVNRQMTRGGSNANTNNPTVTDPVTAQAYVAPDFIVMSYGRDGVGATRRESTTISIACTDGTTKRRFENCDADTSFVLAPTFTAATAADLSYFDDTMSSYTQAVVVPIPGVCNNSSQFSCTAGNSTAQNAGSCGGFSTWTCAGTGGGSNASCSLANAACAVNGVCNNSVQFSCSAGTSTANNAGTCGGNSTWTCTGSGGGSNASCSLANAACVVNGACNNSVALGCTAGSATSDNGQTGCGTTRTWTCAGTGGGSNASCSLANAACAVNGVCNNSVQFSCSAGTSTANNAGSCGGNSTWTCSGANGGSNASCSLANAACPVNGVCNNSTPLGCTAGSATSDNGQTGCGATRTWVCAGSGGGSNSGTCSITNAACPVNGVCNNSTPLGCTAGSATSDNGQTGCGTTRTWVCAGASGGSNSGTCSLANAACPVNGVCNNSVQFSCSAGTSTANNAGSCGGNSTWTCSGANGGSNASCSRANAACPPTRTWQSVGQYGTTGALVASTFDMNCGAVEYAGCAGCTSFPAVSGCVDGGACGSETRPCLNNAASCTLEGGQDAVVWDRYECLP